MMPEMLHRMVACVIAMAPVVAVAQALYSVADILTRQLPAATALRSLCLGSPAAMWHSDTISLAHLTIGGGFTKMAEPAMEQLGDGMSELEVKAGSFRILDGSGVAWGTAGFTSSTLCDVRWTDCIDYLRVAPYVLGDDKGGDMKSRRYEFSGGYATMASAWTLGAHAAYRAEIAYRDVDPRVKAVVSDLRVSIGAARGIGARWSAGITAGINIYSQNSDIEFYSPVNDTDTYPLTGLGTWYGRFAGNTNKSSGHEAVGWNVGGHLLDVGRRGGICVDYESYRMNQRLRSFNNIIPGFTDNDVLTARASYSFATAGRAAIVPVVTFGMMRRRGSENLFGAATGNSYDRIGRRRVYSHHIAGGRAICHVQLPAVGGGWLTISPGACLSSDDERLADPHRRVYAARAGASLAVDYSKASGRWMWNVSAEADGSHAAAKEAELEGLDALSPLGESVRHNYSMLSADRCSWAARVGFGRLCGDLLPCVKAGYRNIRYRGHGAGHQLFISISTIF